MLITRTPLRISIGGGGTDLPSFYRRFGGFVISAAIQKHVYIAINESLTEDYFVRCSRLERVDRIPDIEHDIIRSALELRPQPSGIEITSFADLPAGTGLGSSGSFTVGLLKALQGWQHDDVSDGDLAEEACHIEIDRLGQPVGKQDQYIAAFGGITCFEFRPDDSVGVSRLAIPAATRHDLEQRLLLFFTGYTREAAAVLTDQKQRSEQDDAAMLENLDLLKETGYQIKRCLEEGDTTSFAELMHEHWLRKRERSVGMSNDMIDHWYDRARAAGALGGKLVGAGGGGFLLFLAHDPTHLRHAMSEEGLREVRVSFDDSGSTVLMQN